MCILVIGQCHFKLNSMCRSISWLYEWICDVSILPWIEIYGAIWSFYKCESEWIQMIMWFVLAENDSNFLIHLEVRYLPYIWGLSSANYNQSLVLWLCTCFNCLLNKNPIISPMSCLSAWDNSKQYYGTWGFQKVNRRLLEYVSHNVRFLEKGAPTTTLCEKRNT